MKIYADENMPYVEAFFLSASDMRGELQIERFAGRQCHADMLHDADVLLVRSVTQVNEALLSSAKQLKFVGTATIGTEHVSQHYLAMRDIPFASSPGCNARAVGQYVLSAIKVLEQRYQFALQDKRVGIVGAGNTGSALAKLLDALGVEYWFCDPPLAKTDTRREYHSYESLLRECDIISFHVPITHYGEHLTYHLFSHEHLSQIKPDAILINACRGEVMDNRALLKAKQQGRANPLVLDVWENEPHPLLDLIPHTDIATAHIAGYSLEGKARGTLMLYRAFCKQFGIKSELQPDKVLPKASIHQVAIESGDSQHIDFDTINRLIHLVYDVRRDDRLFRKHLSVEGFDWLRKNHPLRREFSSLMVETKHTPTASSLAALDFYLNY